MRALKRAYSTMAEVLAGVILVSIGLGGAAAWIAPRWASDVVRRTAHALASRSGLQVVTPGATPAAAPVPRPPEAPVRAAPLPESRLDVAALESRLRLLEGTGPQLLPAGMVSAHEPGLDPRAWETLRGPLVAFLRSEGAVPPAGEEDAQSLDLAALAPRAADCLRRLESERRQSSEAVLHTLDPAALARMLAEEDGLSEAQARRLVARLSPAAAAQVFDKLARIAPARAARLFDAAFPAATRAPATLRSERGREIHG